MAALSTLALLAVSAAKTGLDYASQRGAATAAQKQGDFQAGIFRQNAQLADQQAQDAIARGAEGASQVDRQTRLLGGAQRAAFAAQGIDIASGSAADVVHNDQQLGALDALTIRNNARREALGFKTQAAGYLQQADFAQRAGRNQAKGLRNASLGTLLGGATELASIYASAPKSVGAGSGRYQGNRYDGNFTASGAPRGGPI